MPCRPLSFPFSSVAGGVRGEHLVELLGDPDEGRTSTELLQLAGPNIGACGPGGQVIVFNYRKIRENVQRGRHYET